MSDIQIPPKVQAPRARFLIRLLHHDAEALALRDAMLDGEFGYYAKCFTCDGEPPLSGFLEARHEAGLMRTVCGCICIRCWPRPDLPHLVRDKLVEIYQAGELDLRPGKADGDQAEIGAGAGDVGAGVAERISRDSRHLLTKDQRDRLEAKRRAYRASMKCVGVRVEILSRDAIWTHPQALTFQRAIKTYDYLGECAVGGMEPETTVSNAPYLAFMRRHPRWDSDTFVLGLCASCASLPDLRGRIGKTLREHFVRNDLMDHHVARVVPPAELDEVAS